MRESPSEIDLRVEAALESLGVPYEVIDIDPAYADTEAFCEKYGYPLKNTGNAIIVGSKKEPRQFAACVIPATKRLDVNHTVRRLMGVSRLSFAREEDTMALTGMMIGGVTPLALPGGMPIYVDAGLMDLDWLIVGGGSRSTKIKTSPELFRRLPGAQIVEGLCLT